MDGPYKYAHDISLLKKKIRWYPKISLEDGLEQTWKQMVKWKEEKRIKNIK